jgi:hypothetical protein
VLKISGVIRFVYYLGAPAVVREIEIERIKLFLKKHRNAANRIWVAVVCAVEI